MSLTFNQIVDKLARDHLWPDPSADFQFPITAERLSGVSGFTQGFTYMNRYIPLPDNTNTYHVFVAGRLNPELLKLSLTDTLWNNYTDIINQKNMYASAYMTIGLEIPRQDLFFSFGKTKTLLIALRWNLTTGFDYSLIENISTRFYSSTYLQDNPNISYKALSLNMGSSDDVTIINNFYNQYYPQEGGIILFVNGQISSIDQVVINTSVDIIYDPTIKNVFIQDVDNLPTFISELDKQRKYLVHMNDQNQTVDFLDDIDFYIVGYISESSYVGLYYQRNNIQNVRQITFHDYALLTNNVWNIISYFQNDLSHYKFKVVLNIRRTGMTQNPLTTNHRLFQILHISSDLQQTLIYGINAVNELWNAKGLEKSQTMMYLQSYFNQLDQYNSFDIVGYNSTCSRICSPVMYLNTSTDEILLPICYSANSTILEYDYNGALTTISSNYQNGSYQLKSQSTRALKFLSGQTTANAGDIYISLLEPYVLGIGEMFRVYGELSGVWKDVTNECSVTDGAVYPISGYDSLILKTGKYIYLIEGQYASQYFGVSIALTDTYVSQIPYGSLEVYLNGYRMVRYVDFDILGNIVYIYNNNKMRNTNKVLVLGKYFCNSDLSVLDLSHIGVGPISEINTASAFNDQKPYTIIIDNTLFFTNTTYNSEYVHYSIEEEVPNLTYYLSQDSQNLFVAEKLIDDKLKIIVQAINNTFIPAYGMVFNKLTIISPFLGTVLNNLVNGKYNDFIYNSYSLPDINSLLLPLNNLLNIDPLYNSNVSENYYSVYPFYSALPIDLDPYQYKFYKSVLKQYANGKLDYQSALTNIQKYA